MKVKEVSLCSALGVTSFLSQFLHECNGAIFVYLCSQAVTLHDTKQCETWDLGSNFFVRKEDVLSQRMR